ncbi:MAG: iron-containing alcohol dehydrogenase [Desulfovibrio sp.]|jgi:alcohol dehydrogenase class IV|nr:iron-containing alcohol dehydrogenase [Desulfovibrio sp.]
MKFQYFMPTRIFSGERCLAEHGAALKQLGTKALIVTGTYSAKANGSLDDAVKALAVNGQAYCVYDKVMSNPTIACAYEGASEAVSNGCDFVLAIGGGSPMDAGKAVALLAAQEKPVPPAEIFSASYARALPVAAVPTTAGTGSEVTQYAILTNDAAESKTSVATPLLFPRVAFLDAAYMRGLSQSVTVNTAVDALSHAVEGMLSVRASSVSDALAEQSIALIASCIAAPGLSDPDDEARRKLLTASTLAGMVIANTGTTAVHALGYSLTYYKNIDHGRANGLLLARFLAFIERTKRERIAKILACMRLKTVDDFERLLDGLLGKRETLSAAEIEHYAEKAAKAANIANCVVRPEKRDLSEVLQGSLG